MKVQQDVFEFLVEEFGGPDAVCQAFYQNKVAEIASEDKTVKDLLDTAKEAGWDKWLLGLSLIELANAINPPEGAVAAAAPPKAEPKKKQGRMSNADRDALYDQIITYVGENPWSAASDIAEAVDLEPRKLSAHLKKIKELGKLRSQGERASMRYALPDK